MEEQKKVSSEEAQKSFKREGQKKQQRSESKPKKQAKEKVEKKPAAKQESEPSDQKIKEKAEQLNAEKKQTEQASQKHEEQQVEEEKQEQNAAKKSECPFRAGSKKAFLFKLLWTTPTALTRDEISEKMKESGNQTSHSVISSWIRSIKRKGFTVEVLDNEQKKATYRVVKPGEAANEKNGASPSTEKSIQ